MAEQYFRMDTTSMSSEHRSLLLSHIDKSNGSWEMTSVPFIFRLKWDSKDDFYLEIPHAKECTLTPWGIC